MKRYNLRRAFGHFTLATFAMLVFAMLPGCSETEETTPASGGDESSGAAPTGDVIASISGVATFDGPRPERVVLTLSTDATCEAMHADTPLLSQNEIVNENGQIKNVFVYVKNAPAEGVPPAPEAPAVLDQIGCSYTPHIVGMQLGQKLEVRNSDDTLHNVRSFAKINDPFNLGQPKGLPPRMRELKRAEDAIKIKCDVHPWMTGYVFVREDPYFAVTDAAGAFKIDGLPSGDYTLVAWHEKYGETEINITVGTDAVTDANFTFAP